MKQGIQNFLNTSLLAGLLAGLLALGGCAYHLVGHGDGFNTIPADVKTLSLSGNAKESLLSLLRQHLYSKQYVILDASSVTDREHHASIFIHMTPIVYAPSTFDINGVATQYRMIIAGSISIEKNNKTIWQSGLIQRQGDVFVTGGPASIEASRQRLQSDLTKQWSNDVVGRLRSGF